MHRLLLATLLLTVSATGLALGNPSCGYPPNDSSALKQALVLSDIKLPAGFQLTVFAKEVSNARSMCLGANGTVFVGTRDAGLVYALRDNDGDGIAEERFIVAKDLRMPSGVAFRNGNLYVAAIDRILRFDDIENRLSNPPAPVVVFDQFPTDEHHGWRYIAFGPDGKLYVSIGSPCNICESENPTHATITRLNPDGSNMEVMQRGIRNSVGFDWRPGTTELWFTDNNREWLGDDKPHAELNRAPQDGLHFGYPYCHQGDMADPKYGEKQPCSAFTPPVQRLGAHVGPHGMTFCTDSAWPVNYQNQVLIAEHGSFNSVTKVGHKITLVRLDAAGRSLGTETFAEGWLKNGVVSGRPVDLKWMPDGSLLVSDDFADIIYRIVWRGEVASDEAKNGQK